MNLKKIISVFLMMLLILQCGLFNTVWADVENEIVTLTDMSFDAGSVVANEPHKAFRVNMVTNEWDSSTDADGNINSGSIKITTNSATNKWDNQIIILDGNGSDLELFKKGETYRISFDIKADKSGMIQTIINAQQQVYEAGTISLDTADKWERHVFSLTPLVDTSIYFVPTINLNQIYWFDNVKVEKIPSAPELVESIPADGSSVAPASTVTLKFNNEMSDTVYNTENYLLNGEYAVEEVVSMGNGSYKLVLKNSMRGSTSYTLSISNLKDIYMQPLDTFSISFETEAGREPHILTTSPSDGSYNFYFDDVMTVLFDCEIDFDFATTNEITINGGAGIDSILLNSTNKNLLRLKFKNMDYLTKYTVSFNGIKSISGEEMTSTSVSFTTQSQENVIYFNKFSEISDASYPEFNPYYTQLSLENSDYYSGPSSMRIDFEQSDSELSIGAEASLEAGKYYTVSFYIKAADGVVDSPFNVVNGDNQSYVISSISGTGEWQKYIKVFKATNEKLPFLRARKISSVLIDDFKIAETVDTAIMENASSIPKQCERGVSVDRAFKLVFNNAIASCNVEINGETARITELDGNTVIFEPETNLEYSTVYKMNITVRDEYERTLSISREFFTEDVFDTDGIKLYTNYGNPTLKEDITNSNISGGRITAEISRVKNNTGDLAEAALIVALYKDSKMINANFTRFTVEANRERFDDMYINIDVPENISDGEYSVCAFLWNSFENITPYIDCVEIKE